VATQLTRGLSLVGAGLNTIGTLTGGVTGRPETMCPLRTSWDPWSPKLIVPCDTMSLDLYIPVILITYILYHAY
jgi:hypothetical protein